MQTTTGRNKTNYSHYFTVIVMQMYLGKIFVITDMFYQNVDNNPSGQKIFILLRLFVF